MLLTWHNLRHYQYLMEAIRDAITGRCWTQFMRERLDVYGTGDIPAPRVAHPS